MTKVKCFNKETIRQANRIATRRKYNRQLLDSFIKKLPDDRWFPIVFTMIHEHAMGIKVDPHVRCWVMFDDKGTKAFIDCDMKLYNALVEFEVPDQEEAK